MANDIQNAQPNTDDSVFDQFLQPPTNGSEEVTPTNTLVGKVPNPTEPAQLGDDSIFDPYIQPELKAAAHDNFADQAQAFTQGIGQGAIGPLEPMLQRTTGLDPNQIRETAEAHPYLTDVGKLIGLISTGIAGKGLGAALGAVGKVAEVGEGASTVAKIGSKIAQGAIENAAFQSSDEISKLVLNDPNQSIGSASANIGAAAFIGGAFGLGIGGSTALWELGSGSKVADVLKTIASKAGGIEGESLDNATQQVLNRSGIELAPELKGALASDPVFNDMFNTLRQTDTTKAGRALQQTYNDARQRAADSMVESLGRNPKEVENLGDFSKYEAGKELGNTIADSYKEQVDPIASKFQDYRDKYGSVELQPDVKLPTGDTIPGAMSQTVDKISQLALDEGWTTSPSSDIMREVNRVVKELPLQKTVKDLTNYISQIGQNTWDVMNPGLSRAGRLMKNIAKEAEAGALVNKIGITGGAKAVEDFAASRAAYSQQSVLKDALNDRLHIKGANTANFANSLKDFAKTDGEAVYNRLNGKNDADLLNFLNQNYPEAASILKRQHIDQILKTAVDKAAPNMTVNGEQIARGIKQLSPELQSFILPKESLAKIDAISQLMEKFNKSPYNFSNTARTFDKMIEYVPSTVTGMIAALVTGNPIMGGVVGALTKYIGKEVPDAIKLSLLKFMGSAKPISARGFKASVDLISSIQKGENVLTNGAKRVFNVASDNVIGGLKSSQAAYQKLDKLVQNAQTNPDELTQTSDNIGHYMPEHGAAFAAQSARIVSYLANQRPGTDQKAPLDSKMQVSPINQTQYEKTLELALNPMSLLDKVKNGSVTPKDLIDVKAMYPDLYNRMSDKLSHEMANITSKNINVPYKTRIGLSLFMGQPMDSTMSPNAFAVTNPIPQIQPQMPQGASKSRSKGVPSSPALQKLPKAYRTPNEARQERMQSDK